MKRFFLIIPLIISLVLISCGTKYEPVESTADEARVVFTVSAYGKKHDVKYELWRALYLTYRDSIDSEGEEFKSEINELILDRVTDIYSVLALCDKLGINLYSASVEKQIEDYIAAAVEGTDGTEGFESYEDYLLALKKMNLNYSVQVLLLRYAIGLEALDDYYIGTFNAEDIKDSFTIGDIAYTKEDIKEYYYSDKCVRVLRAHIQADAYYEPMEYAKTVKDRMENAAITGESAVATVIINTGLTAPLEVARGYVIARHNLDRFYYSDMTNAAFELDMHEISDPILVNYGEGDVIFVLYKAEKNDAHFEQSYSEIAYVYLADTVGERISELTELLAESVSYTDFFDTLDYSEVSMDD